LQLDTAAYRIPVETEINRNIKAAQWLGQSQGRWLHTIFDAH